MRKMEKLKKWLFTGALSALLLAETIATPTAAMGASATDSIPVKTYAATSAVYPDIANAADNGLYWINEGATYRSGATLQFYATGAGYGPDEPQTLNPVKNSTRYRPVSWTVGNKNGSWKKYTEATSGDPYYYGSYIPGEYRFRDSFTLSTSSASSVHFTLRVKYQKEIYNGNKWVKSTSNLAVKSVNFYIRNVDTSSTGTPRPAVGTRRIRKNVTYRVTGRSTVTAAAPADKSIKNLVIPNTIKINGYYFKVTKISADAFSACRNLKTAVIGENVTAIGKNAFRDSKKLSIVALKTNKLTKSKVGANAFKGIKSNCLFKAPSRKASAYKKLLQAKGAGKKIQVKKYY